MQDAGINVKLIDYIMYVHLGKTVFAYQIQGYTFPYNNL